MQAGLAGLSERADRSVRFRGMLTGGYAGRHTEVWESHCCDDCHEAQARLPGREHGACVFNAAAAAAVDEGVAETVHRDGEWRVELTELGQRDFAERASVHGRRRIERQQTTAAA